MNHSSRRVGVQIKESLVPTIDLNLQDERKIRNALKSPQDYRHRPEFSIHFQDD
jgi:hypothetical protein